METNIDKSKQHEKELDLKMLEKEAKAAYKAGNEAALLSLGERIKGIDPKNSLVSRLRQRLDDAKKQQAAEERSQKIRQCKLELKRIFKQEDALKLKEKAEELLTFDSRNSVALHWIKKAEKMTKKVAKVSAEKSSFAQNLVSKWHEWKQKVIALKQKIRQAKPRQEVGNIFTRMFPPREEAKNVSIIDAIVAKTDAVEKKSELKLVTSETESNESTGGRLLLFSRVFVNFAAIFIVFSSAFLYVEWIDKQNTLLSLMGITENTGGKLHAASEMLADLQKKEAILNKNIELYKEGYEDKTWGMVQTVIQERINWPDIFAKINEVTNSVYELNDFFKYVEYNNYSFDAENRTIRVSGTLSDPLGRNLTKLVELEDAFKNYPRDKGNSEDTTKPYFSGFTDLSSFSKTLDPLTGRYTSSFQLSFSLNQ